MTYQAFDRALVCCLMQINRISTISVKCAEKHLPFLSGGTREPPILVMRELWHLGMRRKPPVDNYYRLSRVL
jgi:hypothetical protein